MVAYDAKGGNVIERCGNAHDYVAVIPNLADTVRCVLANACPLAAYGVNWTRSGHRVDEDAQSAAIEAGLEYEDGLTAEDVQDIIRHTPEFEDFRASLKRSGIDSARNRVEKTIHELISLIDRSRTVTGDLRPSNNSRGSGAAQGGLSGKTPSIQGAKAVGQLNSLGGYRTGTGADELATARGELTHDQLAEKLPPTGGVSDRITADGTLERGDRPVDSEDAVRVNIESARREAEQQSVQLNNLYGLGGDAPGGPGGTPPEPPSSLSEAFTGLENQARETAKKLGIDLIGTNEAFVPISKNDERPAFMTVRVGRWPKPPPAAFSSQVSRAPSPRKMLSAGLPLVAITSFEIL